MKALLSVLIIVILLIFGYNKYADYQRFSLENYQYQAISAPEGADRETAMLYYQKVAALDGYVITQWSTNEIDVRNPEEDDQETLAARASYDKLLGEVKFLENELNTSRLTTLESEKSFLKSQKRTRIKELFTTTSNNELRIGSRGALVFELQKLLNANGSNIPEDGNFQAVTFEALKEFQERNNLFPDGKLDMLTLDYLLEK